MTSDLYLKAKMARFSNPKLGKIVNTQYTHKIYPIIRNESDFSSSESPASLAKDENTRSHGTRGDEVDER